MGKLGNFIIVMALLTGMVTMLALAIDVCGFVRTEGEAVEVVDDGDGEYRVTYRYEAEDGVHTAFVLTNNSKVEVGDKTVVRYSREFTRLIREDEDFYGETFLIAVMAIASTLLIGDCIRTGVAKKRTLKKTMKKGKVY